MLQKRSKPSELDFAIEKVYNELLLLSPEDEKYATVLAHLRTLNEIKNQKDSRRVSPDAWVAAGASLFGILLIVVYEQKHIFSSKAMSMVSKPK